MYTAALPSFHGPIIIRYPRGTGEGVPWRGAEFGTIPIGRGQLLHSGKDVAVLSIGPIGNRAAEAVLRAAELGKEALHYDMRFLKPLDESIMEEVCSKAGTVITVEDGMTAGGLHDAVASWIAERHPGIKVIGLGVPDKFVEQGTISQK